MNRYIIITIATLLMALLIGLINVSNYQAAIANNAKKACMTYFEDRDEKVISFSEVDYSLGMVEMDIITNITRYYVVLVAKEPWWIESTIANYFISPTVEIISVEKKSDQSSRY